MASGETITYAYDSLNRLISTSGTGDPQGNWSQTFSYDGFGNLTSKIGNNAPIVTSYSVNPATNQITSNGAVCDANGNMTAYGSPGQVTVFLPRRSEPAEYRAAAVHIALASYYQDDVSICSEGGGGGGGEAYIPDGWRADV
ncbi:MAG TPA: hypothetical protein VHZ07_11230 [Bryobacteraceae bacterium]|nr:hypothetical protein [Bryobacteraceae bacterium]